MMGFHRLFWKANDCFVTRVGLGVAKALLPASLNHSNNIYRGIKRLVARELLNLTSDQAKRTGRCFCTSTQISRDVVLFHHDRSRFFRLLATFCGAQGLFWTYLAHFAYTGLRDASGLKEHHKVATTASVGFWSFDINLGTNTWRYGFTLGCLAVGGGIVGLGVLFCRRSVSRVMLHKGGRMVTVWTQSPLGPEQGRKITIPLSQVACHAHRHESPSFIPLKIKGNTFYFLLDKEGTINNARLFDTTVGAYRPL